MGSLLIFSIFSIVLWSNQVKSFQPFLEDKFPGHDEITLTALNEMEFCSKPNDYVEKIRKANRNVDLAYSASSAAHCDDEKLTECSTRVVNIANEVIPIIKEIDRFFDNMVDIAKNFPNYTISMKVERLKFFKKLKDKITERYDNLADRLGSALHTIQDFYAHSNFVEKELAGMAPQLQIFDNVITWQNSQGRFCPQNSSILDERVEGFTSGYRRQTTPSGKCIHGTGSLGIHKDTPAKKGYFRAVNKATKASIEFLLSILKKLPSSKQKSLYIGCRSFPSLQEIETFGAAIDVTGSMAEAINGVKSWINKFVLSGEVSFGKFIMVLFNDPAVNEPQTYFDANQFLAAVNSIKVDGGGDCPEMMYTGIEKLAAAIDTGSSIYVFSDADAKDLTIKREIVQNLVKEKNLKLNFILTGQCAPGTRRRRRSVSNSAAKTPTRVDAEKLAALNGGIVVDSSPKEVGTSLEIARRVQMVPRNIVKIGAFPGTCSNVTFSILEKGSNISVVLTHSLTSILSGNDRCLVYTPDDKQLESATYIQTLKTTMISLDNVSQIGEWRMRFCYKAEYQISSDENIQVSLNMLHYIDGMFDTILMPIDGSPLVNRTYRFNLQIESPTVSPKLINKTLQLSLVNTNGEKIDTRHFIYQMANSTTPGTRSFSGHIEIPNDPFYVLISGDTTDRLKLHRYSSKVTPDQIQITPHHSIVQFQSSAANISPIVLNFSIDSQASLKYDLSLLSAVSKGASFIESVRLLNSSTLSLQSNSSVNISVEVVPQRKTFCSQNDTETENTEIFVSASSPILSISNNVLLKIPCIGNVTLPRGCIYTEKTGKCGRDRLQTFQITIIQESESGGVPCPSKLSGLRSCELNSSPSIYVNGLTQTFVVQLFLMTMMSLSVTMI
jgi:von Willebrand factor A domain-containing protein 7